MKKHKQALLKIKYIYNTFRKKILIKALIRLIKVVVCERIRSKDYLKKYIFRQEKHQKLLGKNVAILEFKPLIINSEKLYRRLSVKAFFRLMRRKIVNILTNFLIFNKYSRN